MRDTAPQFSRTAKPSPFCKLDDRMDSFLIEGVVKERLMQRAAEEQLPLTEYVREVLRCDAFGADMVAKVHAERVWRIGRLLGQRRGH